MIKIRKEHFVTGDNNLYFEEALSLHCHCTGDRGTFICSFGRKLVLLPGDP